MTNRENILNKIRRMNELQRPTPNQASLRANNSLAQRLQNKRNEKFNELLEKKKKKAFENLKLIDLYGEENVEDDIVIPKENKFKIFKR